MTIINNRKNSDLYHRSSENNNVLYASTVALNYRITHYSQTPIVRGSIVRDPPRVRGYLFKNISSH